MKKCRHKQFFTLLEVMVSMGVFALLMLALMQFFSAAQTAWERSGGKAELFDSARIATQLLYNDLSASFYGDEYDPHQMGDAADGKFIFYKTGTADSKVHLTFATFRSGTAGLTEVNYVWDPAKLTLSVQEQSEASMPAASLGASGWINYPSNAWIGNIRNETTHAPSEIADNILMFQVRNFYYDNGATPTETPPSGSGAEYRPPALVFITFAALSSAGYEKLDGIIRPSLTGSDEEKTAAVRSQIKTYFDAMRDGDNFKAAAVPESGADVPAKQILSDHVQFFKVMVPINRD